ncbi:hypothetical protein DDZ13_02365 [Coraliomargarita sinensis]|uniref:Uncharacterized protein n=1 Tax=Coraliomargarita sinensis TaxID=2174842 RepID=A0A317ZJ32_9BACT|nr:hypothetical protein [Coraliomargarita sinensis]PXA05734.1 hypothetical protein DDZ13_02365 [Coraliomargarita sinensis]
MEILLNKDLNLDNAADLTPACKSSILKISEDTFAFCGEDERHPHLVVKSAIFALLMQRLERRVVHYDVFRPKCLCCNEEGDIVIRLIESDGYVYHVREDDNVEICMSIEQLYKDYHARN